MYPVISSLVSYFSFFFLSTHSMLYMDFVVQFLLAHYYRTSMLFQLENPFCPDFPTGNARPGQKGCLFVPGLAIGTKNTLLSPNRDKRGCQRHVAGTPFCPGWCYQPGQKVHFFSCFSFLNSFSISIILLHFN